MRHQAQLLTDADVETISEIASADRRSVTRRLAGLPVRGLAGRRIDAAIAHHFARRQGRRSQPEHAA